MNLVKHISFSLSIIIVVIFTMFLFSRSSGFHFQLLALLVITYLVNDLSEPSGRFHMRLYSILIAISFLSCELITLSTSYYLVSIEKMDMFRAISIVITFTALAIMLYQYAKQLSITEQKLFYLAKHDSLTEIYNRRTFTDYGTELFTFYQKKKEPLSIIIIDIDDFKLINDRFGHYIGDKVLVNLATTIQSSLRASDIFARYGGEEFSILLPGTSLEDAFNLAERIRKELSQQTIVTASIPFTYTVSIGVGSIRDFYATFDELLIAADLAMYQAKSQGKNLTFKAIDVKEALSYDH